LVYGAANRSAGSVRTRRALILLPSSGPLITETAVGSGCAITVNFPSDGSPVLRSGRRPLRFSAAFDPVGGRRPRRSSCMQRFAVRLNRNAASILALAHEVFSVRGTLRRYGWINSSASRYKSSPQLELYAPTAVSIPIVLDSSLIWDASTSNAFSKLSRYETK
jgi:hypothetical protein